VGTEGTRLERATRRFDSGDYKKALDDLWHAEAEHRVDKPRLLEARSLAQALVAKTDGRVRKEAETLISVLSSDIKSAGPSPPAHSNVTAVVEPGANGKALGSLALGLLSIPLALFLLGGVAGIAAVVLGIRSLKGNTSREISALVGIVCGITGVVLALLMLYWLATFDLTVGL
jgi:hypothetical protein